MPIVALEAAIAAVNMPLAFARSGEHTQLVAVLSARPGRNSFVDEDGRWLGAYIPAAFRTFPFRLGRVEGRDEHVLCIASEGDHLVQGDQPIYEESGELSAQVQQIVSFLNTFEASRQQALAAGAALIEAGVLAPWPIRVRDQSGSDRTIGGMLRVDEQALSAVPDKAFLKLRRVGALGLAYAQMLSVSRLEILSRLSYLATSRAQSRKKELNLDFLREEDGNLVF